MNNPKQIIDKETYRMIKRLDRNGMSKYFVDLYKNIYCTLLEDIKAGIDLEAVEKEVREIKGIGEVKAEAIMTIIKNHIVLPEITEEK